MRCPQGHDSQASDYCDVCGSPMGAMGATSPPVGSAPSEPDAGPAGAGRAADGQSVAGRPGSEPAGAQTQTCPHCGTVNSPDALFCEACGYDFTTGVMPRPVALTDGTYVGGAPLAADPAPAEAAEGDPAPADAAATGEPTGEPATGEPAGEPATGEPATAVDARGDDGDDEADGDSGPVGIGDPGRAGEPAPTTPPPATPAQAVQPPEPSQPAEPAPSGAIPSAPSKRMAYRPPSRVSIADWVVEIWIDPDWYAGQQSPEPCPSPGVPDVVAAHDGALVGRPSASRNIRPDIDCGTDTGVSRRQALLTTDGRRWWIEDLGSSNGTYVGPASGPLPVDPITSKVEVDADDRIYVGAWTRLVVRPATDSERAGLG